MAQFNADILFNADVRKALKGIDRLEGGIRSVIVEVEKFEKTFKRLQGPKGHQAILTFGASGMLET